MLPREANQIIKRLRHTTNQLRRPKRRRIIGDKALTRVLSFLVYN